MDIRHAPESFVDKLDREFRGRLRIRWSQQQGEWRIEQKVARGLFPGSKPTKSGWDSSVDRYVEHRDGYVHIMSVRTGDRMPCPRCGHELKVPFKDTTHLKCEYCRLIGRQTYVPAVFFPLSDSLIDHLKSIDPENPISEGLAERLDRENEALAARMEADAIRDSVAAFNEDYRRVVGIPYAHLSGRTKFWSPKEAA
jgi:hypothetical protein